MRRVAWLVLIAIGAGWLLLAAPASASVVTTWSALKTAMAAGGTVTLGANIVPPVVPTGDRLDLAGATTTLDLHGYRLTIPSPPANQAAIHVAPGASLTVEDTVGTGLLTVTGGTSSDAAIGGDYLGGSVSESNGFITFKAGSHSIVTAGSGGGHTIGPSGNYANALWTNAGVLTLNGLTPMDGQAADGLINTGTIYFNGNMWGLGTLTNNGVIVVGPSPDAIATGYTWVGNHYVVGYNVNYAGGTNPASQTVYGPTFASTSQTLPTLPKRIGYTSLGWFTAASAGIKVTTASALASLHSPTSQTPTLSAHWALIKESVTFNSRGGSTVATQGVNYGSAAKLPRAPTRPGYTFVGWSSSTTGKPLWTFSSSIKSPVTLYAVWKAVPVKPVTPVTPPVTPPITPPPYVPPYVAPVVHPKHPHATPTAGPTATPSPTPSPSPSPSPTTSPSATPSGAGRGGSTGGGSGTSQQSGWTQPSSLSPSIPSIYDILSHPERIGLAIASGLVWTLLLLLATSSLDKAVSSNYDAWLGAAKARFPKASAVFSKLFGFGHDRTWIAIVAVLLADAIVLDFVDPHFRPNATSARLLMSSTTAVFVETFIPCFIIIAVARRRYGTAGRLRATPFGLLIGAMGVLISRLLGFLPGLLGGSTMTYDEPDYKTGERVWLARLKVILVLTAASVCWVLLSVIPAHGSMPDLFFHDAAVIGAAAAITGTVLDLVPFAVFGGSLLYHHARLSWAGLMVVSSVAFFLLVVPQPRYWLFVGPRVLWWVIIATIVIFAAVALLGFLQWKRGRAAEGDAGLAPEPT